MLPRIVPEFTVDSIYLSYLSELAGSGFAGEIKTDFATRLSLATDNSIYQVIPQAVLFPKSTADISLALKISQQPDFDTIKFAPRGGGTGTNGQSLSAGIIIDCSKYLKNILEMNLEGMWVRVQPGVVLDQLNQYLREHDVYFAPEISPSNRATIGGMINTDACGNGSKMLGRTSDHVAELTLVLADGSIHQTNEMENYQHPINTLLHDNQQEISKKFTSAPRTLTGYNLAKASQHLNYLFCGAEGTLAVVSECKLKLSPLPKFKRLLVVKYQTFSDALRFSELTADIRPLVIESIDEKLISLARQDVFFFQIKDFIGEANAVNIVEFVSDNEFELEAQVKKLCANVTASSHATGFYLAKNNVEIKLLWELRKKSVGLISKRQDGTRRPIPFIEDTAVPPEHLADYIAEFKLLLDKHHLVYGMYGHVDAGCVHVRPALDLKLANDEKLLRELSSDVVALVKKYHGVIWGEHGKGYRSEFTVDFFGEPLYLALRKIKTLFDPCNKLNPGKIVTPLESSDAVVKLEDNLRARFDKQIPGDWQAEFANPLACNGNGACFNFSTQDVMCPSFKVTQDRVHSPKGRAMLAREWLRLLALSPTVVGWIRRASVVIHPTSHRSDFSHEVYSALNGCLGCKACTTQCPLNVDIPAFKSTFLSRYHQRYRRPLRDYLIAKTETLANWLAKLPRIANWFLANKLTKKIVKTIFQLEDLPTLGLHNHNNLRYLPSTLANALPQNAIILIQDVLTSFYEPSILENSYALFTQLGYEVYVAPFFENGKPLHVKGFLNQFNKLAKKNIAYLQQLNKLNIPLIGLDPSITLTYRDEYKKLLNEQKSVLKIFLPQEFLQTHAYKTKISQPPSTKYYLLSHCTEKSLAVESEKQWQAVFSQFGLELIPLAAGCCGMAGFYGHESEHINLSRELFNMSWQTHLVSPTEQKVIMATGSSCRNQTKRFAGITLQHPLEVLTKILSQQESL